MKKEQYEFKKQVGEAGAVLMAGGIILTALAATSKLDTAHKLACIAGGVMTAGCGALVIERTADEMARLYSEMDTVDKVAVKIDEFADKYLD